MNTPTRDVEMRNNNNNNVPTGLKVTLLVLFLLCVTSTSFAVYFYTQVKHLAVAKAPEQIPVAQVKDVVAKVGKLIVLPEDEEPTLATVADPAQLQNQPFFARAKKGDQVLVYTVARKVILYDPVANKVIDIAPLNVPAPTPTPVVKTGTISATPKVTPIITPKSTVSPTPSPIKR